MVQTSTQQWDIGLWVKVGFMRLKIVAITPVKDSLPDIYTLVNADNTRRYEFIPHNGLTRI